MPSYGGRSEPAATSRPTRPRTKLIYLVLRNAAAEWKMPLKRMDRRKVQFAIVFGDRFVTA